MLTFDLRKRLKQYIILFFKLLSLSDKHCKIIAPPLDFRDHFPLDPCLDTSRGMEYSS